MKILLAIPVIALVCAGVLWSLGVFNQEEDKQLPPVEPLPPVESEEPIIPTEPDCEDNLYVTIYRYDLRTGEFDWYMYEGDMKCHNIDAYKESPDFAVEYDNGFWLEVD